MDYLLQSRNENALAEARTRFGSLYDARDRPNRLEIAGYLERNLQCVDCHGAVTFGNIEFCHFLSSVRCFRCQRSYVSAPLSSA